MEKITLNKIILLTTLSIIFVVGSYIIGIGIIGEAKLSFESKDWVNFSSFFNGMLTPFLAAIAAGIAFFSLTHQLKVVRDDSSLNEQISNYLKHIKLLQNMIDKRWSTISKISKMDWEEEPFYAINQANIKNNLLQNGYLAPEIVRLCRFFEDLVDAAQWYTSLHKQKIDLNNPSFSKNEWSHFSTSIINEQDKKMHYCYEYCLWLTAERNEQTEKYLTEIVTYVSFYENLYSSAVLYKQ